MMNKVGHVMMNKVGHVILSEAKNLTWIGDSDSSLRSE